jgi:hypothetical protein
VYRTKVPPEQVQSMIDTNNKESHKSFSQHPIQNALYEGICLGGNTTGIHGMTPDKLLHVLELGLLKPMIKGFYVRLQAKFKVIPIDTPTAGHVSLEDW